LRAAESVRLGKATASKALTSSETIGGAYRRSCDQLEIIADPNGYHARRRAADYAAAAHHYPARIAKQDLVVCCSIVELLSDSISRFVADAPSNQIGRRFTAAMVRL
jgi:hypothetical protein